MRSFSETPTVVTLTDVNTGCSETEYGLRKKKRERILLGSRFWAQNSEKTKCTPFEWLAVQSFLQLKPLRNVSVVRPCLQIWASFEELRLKMSS